jgi:hypothetical protein
MPKPPALIQDRREMIRSGIYPTVGSNDPDAIRMGRYV